MIHTDRLCLLCSIRQPRGGTDDEQEQRESTKECATPASYISRS